MSEQNTDAQVRSDDEPRKVISPTGVIGSIGGLAGGGYFGHSLAKAFEYSIGSPSYLGSVGILAILGVAGGVLLTRWVAAQMTRPDYSAQAAGSYTA